MIITYLDTGRPVFTGSPGLSTVSIRFSLAQLSSMAMVCFEHGDVRECPFREFRLVAIRGFMWLTLSSKTSTHRLRVLQEGTYSFRESTSPFFSSVCHVFLLKDQSSTSRLDVVSAG
ncbi:hypothetical protein KIN20_035685 [Parelaphostrongylus tenuis]|uniref:Uncharacterized protein n=1 Tax=Parelaphostrongylus tenuis TaxID=148309 RepID=A0AAD5RC50_PARTN|nr:hypothetical protein KIN20_035685 [Parelaphostrongylus tenuis]